MRNRIFTIVIIIAIAGVVIHILRTSYKTFESSQRVRQLAADVEVIQEENRRLRRELKERESPLFVEKIARNKLNLAQAGERLVVIQDDEIINPEEEFLQQLEQKTPWEQWRILLFRQQ